MGFGVYTTSGRLITVKVQHITNNKIRTSFGF